LRSTKPAPSPASLASGPTGPRSGKVKEGETTNDLYAFQTTEPNAEVGAIHPKAMPSILTTPDEVEI
jgi:putative SOS response-associated peptidase YedK